MIPTQIEELLEQYGVHVPSEIQKELEEGNINGAGEVYHRMLTGCCATCGSELGDTTMIVMGAPYVDGQRPETHIVMVFCGGACLQDMQITGWLQEVYDDINQRIQFRGGMGDRAEGGDASH